MIDWDKQVLAPLNKEFGESVTYTPASTRQAVTITGVFDEAYHLIDSVGDGAGSSTVTPVLGIRAAEMLVEPRQRDELIIVRTGGRYVVNDVRPDSHGHILLVLNYRGQVT